MLRRLPSSDSGGRQHSSRLRELRPSLRSSSACRAMPYFRSRVGFCWHSSASASIPSSRFTVPSSIRPAYVRPGLASLKASVVSSVAPWLPISWPSSSPQAACWFLTSSLRSWPWLASAPLLCWAQKRKDGPLTMSDLHNQLIHWATVAPEQICIVEAETGQSMTYRHCLSAVQKMRQLLGIQPRNLMLTLSGGIADAVLWLAALTGGHMLVPLAPDAQEEERARAVSMYKPDVLFVEQAEEARGFPGAAAAQIVTRQDCEALIEQACDCVPLADKSAMGAKDFNALHCVSLRPLHLDLGLGAGIA